MAAELADGGARPLRLGVGAQARGEVECGLHEALQHHGEIRVGDAPRAEQGTAVGPHEQWGEMTGGGEPDAARIHGHLTEEHRRKCAGVQLEGELPQTERWPAVSRRRVFA